MKHFYVFPGQGAQYTGMGKDLYDTNPEVRQLMERANEILGFRPQIHSAVSRFSASFLII